MALVGQGGCDLFNVEGASRSSIESAYDFSPPLPPQKQGVTASAQQPAKWGTFPPLGELVSG